MSKKSKSNWAHYVVTVNQRRRAIVVFCDFEKVCELQFGTELETIGISTFNPFVIGQDATSQYRYGLNATLDDVLMFKRPLEENNISQLRHFYFDNPEQIAGDVNWDGSFDLTDIVVFQKWLLGISNISLLNWQAVDYNNDETIDVFDLCLMKRSLLSHAIREKKVS